METFDGSSADDCAGLMLEVVPSVMRAIREHMRGNRAKDLTVVQFRTLAFLNRHEGAALSSIAEHIGLTRPAASKIINLLVSRALLSRRIDPEDRRKNVLVPTTGGRRMMEKARAETRAYLARLLAPSGESERKSVVLAMRTLQPIFVPEDPAGKGESKIHRPRQGVKRGLAKPSL